MARRSPRRIRALRAGTSRPWDEKTLRLLSVAVDIHDDQTKASKLAKAARHGKDNCDGCGTHFQQHGEYKRYARRANRQRRGAWGICGGMHVRA